MDEKKLMENPFNEVEMGAWGGLLSFYGHLMRIIEADLEENARITHVEYEVLLRLSWAEGRQMRIQDLAAQSLLTRSGISRVVERMEKAGLVTREIASEDRRGAYAILTDVGLARLHKAGETHIAIVRQHFLNFFNEAELVQLAEFWQRLEAAHRDQ